MKNLLKTSWLLFGLIILISCKKKTFDHRNKFVGNWEFQVEKTEINTDSIGYYHYDSFTFQGQIKYGNGEHDLLIEYSNGNSITLTVDKEDILSNFPNKYCSGEFEAKDNLHLYLRWGGLGGGVTHVVDGKKIINYCEMCKKFRKDMRG